MAAPLVVLLAGRRHDFNKLDLQLKRVLYQQIFMKELAQPMVRKELTEKMLNTELTLSTESTVLVPARLRMQLSARTDATPLQVNAQNAVAPMHEKER